MTYRKDPAPGAEVSTVRGAGNADQSLRVAFRAVVKWLDNELAKVENNLRIPEVRGLQFETLTALPARYREGDLYYFAAGVAGGSEGLYIRDAGNWRKL